jgi:O-antigen/teichoic acid export membrane protein
MKNKLVNNIFFSFLEKTFQITSGFLTSFFIIRLLEREKFGVIGIVAGFYALINIFNFSYESIIIRDHKKMKEDEIGHFLAFSTFKMLVLLVLSTLLAIYLKMNFSNSDFYYAVGSIFLVFSIDFLSAPIVLIATSKFRHDLVSLVSFVRYFFNVAILLGLFYFPTLEFIFLKDLIVFLVVFISWAIVLKVSLKIKTNVVREFFKFDLSKFKSNVTNYSLWTHLISCVTFFIYRADTLFLSLFTPVKVIGNYNVALSCGNFANIAPSILGFQNTVAISNLEKKEDVERVSSSFARMSIISSFLMFLGLMFTGELLLRIITGEENVEEIFFFTKCIVFGLLLVKSLASPMVSVIQMKGDVKSLFYRVNIPVFIVTALSYYFTARIYGARGVALANIFNSAVWIILVFIEYRKLNLKLDLSRGYMKDLTKLINILRSKFVKA